MKSKAIDREMMENSEFLWRWARALYCLGQVSPADVKKLAMEALPAAARSVEINENSCNAHNWCSVNIIYHLDH